MVRLERRSRQSGGTKVVSSRSNVKSCLRALDVIEFFAGAEKSARTAEVSDALGIPNSSADEILRTLACGGWLDFNRETKRYAPSYKLICAGSAIERGFFGGERLRSLLHSLRRETGASAYLIAQNDCWLEPVSELEGNWLGCKADEYRRTLVQYDADGWRPTGNFAGALLARYSNVELIAIAVRSQQLGIAPQQSSTMEDLINRVDRIRSRGFALCQRKDSVIVDSIACPLNVPNSVTGFAVGILGQDLFPNPREIDRLASKVRRVVAAYA